MDSNKRIELCFSDDNKTVKCNELNKSFKRLDFEGLIIEIRESNVKIKKPTSSNVQKCDDCAPLDVNGVVVCNNTKPTKTAHSKIAQSIPETAVNECLGAAGLWIQNAIQVNGTHQKELEVVPPSVTEEDLAIIRQFMETPDPENHLGATNRLMTNQEEFVCSICESFILEGEGVVLKCLHNFCRDCLIDEINDNHDAIGQVKCPFSLEKCESYIVDEEVKDLLGDDYTKFIYRIVQMQDAAEREEIRNAEASKYDTLPALLETDNHDFIENFEKFECSICLTDIQIGAGVILKNCLHKFCKECIIETVKYSDEFIVKCPNMDDDGSCEFTVQEREIRGLVPDNVFDKLLEKSLQLYEGVTTNAYHCKTPDCKGLIEIEQNAINFICEVCAKENCIKCKVIHEGKNCQEYQDEINPDAKHQRENVDSENAIKSLIVAGEAMKCPRCEIIVMKKDGCDFLTCSTCKLGICWRTKKPRLPLTKLNGTVVDGCHCKENGVVCHPLCQNCH